MTTEHDDASYELPHSSSPTDHVLAELQLYGYRPFQDEPEPRPLPKAHAIAGAVASSNATPTPRGGRAAGQWSTIVRSPRR
jgi:hypothetical protein